MHLPAFHQFFLTIKVFIFESIALFLDCRDLREIEKLAGDGKAVVEMFGVYDTDGEAEVSDPYYESDIGAFERVIIFFFRFKERMQLEPFEMSFQGGG